LREGDNPGALRLLVETEETLVRYASFYAPMAKILLAHHLYENGQIGAAVTRLKVGRALATDAHTPFFAAAAAASLAKVYGCLGLDEAMREARSAALEAVDSPLGGFIGSTVWVELGYASLAIGDLPAAADAFDKGLSSSSASKYWEKARLLIGRALVRTRQGDFAGAHSSLDEAQTFLLEKEVRAFDAHLEQARGESLLAEGKTEEAAARLAAAQELATASELRVLTLQIATAAARAATVLGDSDAARHHLDTARAAVEEIARSVDDPDLKRAVEAAWAEPLDQIVTG
jgi:predicted negative regulator of RcsB-dependent stress response